MTPRYRQTGVILFTENYEACLDFYENLLGLEREWQKETLTRFRFGGSYLLVEKGGTARPHEKSFAESPATLRLDVDDVEAAAEALRARGVPVTITVWDWGITGAIVDPDGNRVELKNFEGGQEGE